MMKISTTGYPLTVVKMAIVEKKKKQAQNYNKVGGCHAGKKILASLLEMYSTISAIYDSVVILEKAMIARGRQ